MVSQTLAFDFQNPWRFFLWKNLSRVRTNYTSTHVTLNNGVPGLCLPTQPPKLHVSSTHLFHSLDSASQQGVGLALQWPLSNVWRHFRCHPGGLLLASSVEIRNIAQHPLMHREPTIRRSSPIPNINSAEVEKAWSDILFTPCQCCCFFLLSNHMSH